ncbi:Equilibrative nucleotide transporter 3 [Linum perenne]
MGICIWYEARMDTRTRNIVGYSLIFFSTLMLLLVSHIFFTMGGVVGELSFMCPGFIQVNTRLITKAAFENAHNGLRKGVLLFMAISVSIELMCILLYAFYLPKLPIVNYYRTKASKEESKTVTAGLRAAGIRVPENKVSHNCQNSECTYL